MDKNLIKTIELKDIPYEYKKWKTLFEYRNDISFLPSLMRDKVAEQLMACDYLLSLEIWLKPISIINKRHKRIYVQQIASVYEGIIDSFIEKEILALHKENILAKELSSKNLVEYRTFHKSIELVSKIKSIDSEWKEYLIKICEIRNYIHLSKDERIEAFQWLENNSSESIRLKLDDFIIYAKDKLK